MEEVKPKIVQCHICTRPFEIPAKPEEDGEVICACRELHYYSDFGVCKPGYTVTFMLQ